MTWEKNFRTVIEEASGNTMAEKLQYVSDYLKKMVEDEKSNKKDTIKLVEIHNQMVRDFNSNQKRHSNWTNVINGVSHFYYSFKNGNLLNLDDNGVLYFTSFDKDNFGTSKYNLDFDMKSKFSSTIGSIVNKQEEDFFKDDDDEKFSYEFYECHNSKTKSGKEHPKYGIYEALISTIKSRKEQLEKLAMNHPDRVSLQNELNAAISRSESMEKKYNF